MSTDHYIPKFLTKPWELGEHQLMYFDFETQEFGQRSARNMFSKSGLNSEQLERWLNRTIETPGARYVNQLRRGSGSFVPDNWAARRALALLFLLNPQRIEEARGTCDANLTLEDIANDGLRTADLAAQWVYGRFQVAVVHIPDAVGLFFTEVTSFVVPQPDRPVLAVPLGLHHAALFYDGPANMRDVLSWFDRDLLVPLSLGIGSKVHRVVLPPAWREHRSRDEDDTRDRLMGLRDYARRLTTLVGEASLRVGLSGWGPT